jgi:hypothetical protein
MIVQCRVPIALKTKPILFIRWGGKVIDAEVPSTYITGGINKRCICKSIKRQEY